MAQGNLILGTMKGKLGDIVAYNYNGKQAARVRRRQVSNPKSSKQAIQRAIAATVAKFVSAFAPILNNSLQNESSKVSTLAKIRSLNMNMLRQLAAQNLGAYAPKGTQFVAPNGYIISRGTLSGLKAVSYVSGMVAFGDGEYNNADATSHASQIFPMLAVGDQITVLVAYTEDITEGSNCVYCRFAFKDDTTPCFVAEGDRFKLNPAAIDLTKAEGPWDKLIFDDGLYVGKLVGEADSLHVDMVGVITSREDGKLRSNASMLPDDSDYTLSRVYPTYMAGGTPIDMPSELYLNNDANAE